MYRTALRNLLSHKLRLMLSGMAVVLGVAFVSGTMVFTDTLSRTFTDIFESSSADVNVEPAAAFETGLAGTGVSSAQSTVPTAVVEPSAIMLRNSHQLLKNVPAASTTRGHFISADSWACSWTCSSRGRPMNVSHHNRSM